MADRVGSSPFLRPGWVSAWWTAFGGGRLEVAARRRGDRIAALVPLKRVGAGLAATANWHTPEMDLLAEDEGAAEVLAKAIFATRCRRITLLFAEPSSPGLRVCRDAARRSGYRAVVRTRQRSPHVVVSGSFEDFDRRLDRSLRTNVRRRGRRLAERGRVTFDVVDSGDDLEDALREGFGIEGSGWKTAGRTAIASRSDTRRFYTDVARWAAARGWLQLAFLRLDGQPLAFHFNLRAGRVLYHLKGGYDPAFSRLSPSKLLHYEMLRRAFAQGLVSYEFLGDQEPWKREWTSDVRERQLLEAFAPSPTGLLEWAAHVTGRPAIVRLRAVRRRLRSGRPTPRGS